MNQTELSRKIKLAPPIVRAAIFAIIEHEDKLNNMGYDISYYQEDLPAVVREAIKPWKDM